MNWKKLSPTCVSTSQVNFIVLIVPQSGTKTWCRLEFISRTNKLRRTNCYRHAWKQNPWWWQKLSKDVRRISNKFPFNTSLSLREFSRFKGLVRPNRTGDIDFFRNRRQYFIIQVLILTQLFFNKSTWRWTIARTKCGHKFAFCQVWNVEIWAWAASVFTV